MDTSQVPSSEDYPIWFNDRVRLELKRRRLELGKSPYSMAIPGKLTDQTIINIENGKHSPSLTTLALYCQQLSASVEKVIITAVEG